MFKGRKTAIGTTAELKPDGTYEVATPEGGLRLDTYDIAIQPPLPAPIDPADAAKGVVAPPVTTKIPKKYQDYSTSGFSVTVKEGTNPGDFEMKSK